MHGPFPFLIQHYQSIFPPIARTTRQGGQGGRPEEAGQQDGEGHGTDGTGEAGSGTGGGGVRGEKAQGSHGGHRQVRADDRADGELSEQIPKCKNIRIFWIS